MDQINRIGVGGTGEEENKHPTSSAGREKWKARGKSGVTKQVHKKQEGKEQSKKVLCFFPPPPPPPPPPKKKILSSNHFDESLCTRMHYKFSHIVLMPKQNPNN